MLRFFKPDPNSTIARVLDTKSVDPEAGRVLPPRPSRDWHVAHKVQRYGHSGQVDANPVQRRDAA